MDESWIILSPIEQSIKEKIEAVGKPLKDWNISINYGIKTGFNDAFIINAEKREEILNNCKTAEERQNTDDLIRPILRGKDIKRYSYEFANQYLITTYNGYTDSDGVFQPSIDVNDYPAIKNHLDSYWPEINKRQDKGDTPYNLRRCAYMDDFSKPKLIWKVIGNQMAYTLDKEKFMLNNACYLLTGEHLEYLVVMLNSDAMTWYSFITNMNQTGVGDVQVGKQNILLLPISNSYQDIELLTNEYSKQDFGESELDKFELEINAIIGDIYNFTNTEKIFLKKFRQSL